MKTDVQDVFCIFCIASNPTWEYPCEDFHTLMDDKFIGSFYACDACHEVIEDGTRQQLLERVLLGTHESPIIQEHIERYLDYISNKFSRIGLAVKRSVTVTHD